MDRRVTEDGPDLFEAAVARSGQSLANSLKSWRLILLETMIYGKSRAEIEKSGQQQDCGWQISRNGSAFRFTLGDLLQQDIRSSLADECVSPAPSPPDSGSARHRLSSHTGKTGVRERRI